MNQCTFRGLCGIAAAWLIAAGATAQSPPVVGPPVEPNLAADAHALDGAPAELTPLINRLVREHLPRTWEDDSDWGKKKRFTVGLDVSVRGLKIETRRDRRDLNHGTWTRFSGRMIDPERRLGVRITRMQPTDDGRIEVEAVVEAGVAVQGRLSRWQRGLQLLSVSLEAEADLHLRLTARIATRVELTSVPPAVALVPEVTATQATMRNFKVHRISKLGGPLAQEIGDSLEGTLRRRLERQSAKLPEKINRKIAKNQDKLRLSAGDFFSSQWAKWSAQADEKSE